MIIYTYQKSKKRKINAKQRELKESWEELVKKTAPKKIFKEKLSVEVFNTKKYVRETPKINRNDTVTIKHVLSGKTETMKFKKAEPLVNSGEWVII